MEYALDPGRDYFHCLRNGGILASNFRLGLSGGRSPFSRPIMTRRRIAITVVVFAGLAILFLSFTVPVTREMGWIDAVTASTKHQTYVTFGFDMTPLIETTPVIEPSPLADWLARQEGEVTYDWRHINGTMKTIWGKSVGCGHGAAPPIYFFPRDLLERFVKSSSDNDLRHFVDVMRHGTKQEQKAAVEAAVNKELGAMSRSGYKDGVVFDSFGIKYVPDPYGTT